MLESSANQEPVKHQDDLAGLHSNLLDKSRALKQSIQQGDYKAAVDEYSLFTVNYYEDLGKVTGLYLQIAKAHEERGEYAQAIEYYRRNYWYVGDSYAADRLGLNRKAPPSESSPIKPDDLRKANYSIEELMSLAYQYLGGIGVEVDKQLAFILFKDVIRAFNGLSTDEKKQQRHINLSLEACDVLSYCYRWGVGTYRDIQKALKFNKLAANRNKNFDNGITKTQGYPPALYRQYEFHLAGYYHQDRNIKELQKEVGFNQSVNDILLNCAKAFFGCALHTLAILLQAGGNPDPRIPCKTKDQVEPFYLRSGSMGVRHSYYSLGINALGSWTVENGTAVLHNENIEKALKWLRRAEETGDVKASHELGKLFSGHYQSNHIQVDHAQAITHFKRAGDYPPARIALAKYYFSGQLTSTEYYDMTPKEYGKKLLLEATAHSRHQIHYMYVRTEAAYQAAKSTTSLAEKNAVFEKRFSTDSNKQDGVYEEVKQARASIFAAYQAFDCIETHYHYVIAHQLDEAFDKLFKNKPREVLRLLIDDKFLTSTVKLAKLLHIEENLLADIHDDVTDRLWMAIADEYFYNLPSNNVGVHADHLREAESDPSKADELPALQAHYTKQKIKFEVERQYAEDYYKKISAEAEEFGEAQSNLFCIYSQREKERDDQKYRYQHLANQAMFSALTSPNNPIGFIKHFNHSTDYLKILNQYFPQLDQPKFFQTPDAIIYRALREIIFSDEHSGIAKLGIIFTNVETLKTQHPEKSKELMTFMDACCQAHEAAQEIEPYYDIPEDELRRVLGTDQASSFAEYFASVTRYLSQFVPSMNLLR